MQPTGQLKEYFLPEMKTIKEKLNTVFVLMLIVSICFGFSAFKVMQSKTTTNYSHSKNCQKEHYLELDCFDSCNGKQIHAHSHQQHNAPVEVVIISAFDALIMQPIEIVPAKQTISQIPETIDNLFFTSFLKYVFRPPLFA